MPNKNYIKGKNKEHKIIRGLKKEGFDIVQRSRGSKSAIDIWAIKIKEKKIRLVQSKAGYLSNPAKQRMIEENKELNGMFEVEFVLEN